MCGGTVTIHKTAACLTPQTGILCVVFAYTGNQNNAKTHKEEDAAYAGTTSTDAKRPHPAVAAHPRDTEHERYHPELEEELKECLFCLKRNEMMFDLEVDTDLIEQRIYERQALLCRYRYLLARARELGLHTVLTKYQPQI